MGGGLHFFQASEAFLFHRCNAGSASRRETGGGSEEQRFRGLACFVRFIGMV